MHTPSPLESPSAPERGALIPMAAQARAAAQAAGGPVLACYAAPLPAHDPLAVLQALGAEAPFRFYWEQPSAGFALAAGGVARCIATEGAARFRAAAERVEQALATAVSAAAEGSCPGPYVLGGFSFFDRVEAANWPGFGAAQLVVPAWLTLRQDGACLALVTAEVRADSTPEDVAGALARSLAELRRAATTAALPNGEGQNRAFHQEARTDGRAAWLETVRLARGRIREGRLSKVVLARALDLTCESAPSPLGLLRRLRGAYPDCYNFLIDPGAGQTFLGATPERMARFGNGRVQLAALAGTVPRGTTEEADQAYARLLLESRKEREEHQIVVDSILAAVQGLGRVDCPQQPRVVQLTNLQHLYTPITLEPGGPLPMLTLLERLHPTAAVGGHPREEAFALIRECERFERGWYGAPVGWMNARGEGEFAVALRTGKLAGTRLQLFAGGGIVADSDPEHEYEETQIKFQPILSALASE